MEEDLIKLEMNERWGCDISFGWIPITGDVVIPHTEIYQSKYFHAFFPDLQDLLRSVFNVTEVFEWCEGGNISLRNLADCYFAFDGLEYIYFDKHFQFVLYFSHESSVTVGGKELLESVRMLWPEAALHIWTTPFYK